MKRQARLGKAFGKHIFEKVYPEYIKNLKPWENKSENPEMTNKSEDTSPKIYRWQTHEMLLNITSH